MCRNGNAGSDLPQRLGCVGSAGAGEGGQESCLTRTYASLHGTLWNALFRLHIL